MLSGQYHTVPVKLLINITVFGLKWRERINGSSSVMETDQLFRPTSYMYQLFRPTSYLDNDKQTTSWQNGWNLIDKICGERGSNT